MRSAIVHYHMRSGGVRRVIQNGVAALSLRGIDSAVICGGPLPAETGVACPVGVVDGLDYPVSAGLDPARLVSGLRQAARKALGASPDIWHFHNHSLGKNPVLAQAVNLMAKEGDRLLLQIHDLAEDGRPGLFRRLLDDVGSGDTDGLGRVLYPALSNVHYAFINRRDAAVFALNGLEAHRIHSLRNPVEFSRDRREDSTCPSPNDPELYLYPTRAIRRKNLGEFIFWAAADDAGRNFAVTLAPENPQERLYYDQWVAFAAKHKLKVGFEAGSRSGQSFSGLLAASSATVTTSIAEGFGLAFLEPWLAGKPVFGRKIPGITDEFEEAGLDLRDLYSELMVPVEWLDAGGFFRRLREGYRRLLEAYGQSAEMERVEDWIAWVSNIGMIDFGRLDENAQMEIISRVCCERFAGGWMPERLHADTDRCSTIAANCQLIEKEFSLSRYADDMVRCYDSVMASPVLEQCSAVNLIGLISRYVSADNFRLLRS